MARTAPSGVIATSAPWVTLNLTLLAASSSMMAASATLCSFGSIVVSTTMLWSIWPTRSSSTSPIQSAT